MKRSLLITIVVLLMAALFVSCNANKAEEDQLFEVTIEGSSRALEASATLDVDIEQLYWFYTAEKLGGIFKKGEHKTLTPVRTVNNAPAKGISGTNLGEMSTGPWEFYFKGYTAINTDGTPKGEPVYKQDALRVQLNANLTLALTLERGSGELPDPRIGFAAEGVTWMIDGVGDGLTLNLSVDDEYEEEETPFFGPVPGTYDSDKGKYVFAASGGTYPLAVGVHTLTAKVFNSYYNVVTDTLEYELVGECYLVIDAQPGMQYIVSDVSGDPSGVTPLDEDQQPVAVVDIGEPSKPLEATTTIAATSEAITRTVNVSPAGAATDSTTVAFDAGCLDGDEGNLTLDVVTYSAEVASAKYVITTDDAVVAGIDLTLKKENGEPIAEFGEGDEFVTITTFIGTNLENVTVLYDGSEWIDPENHGLGKYLVDYEPSTGKLIFKTNHFSEFVVLAYGPVRIGSKYFGTLDAALAAVQNSETITFCSDYTVPSTRTEESDRYVVTKAITIDFGQYKLYVPGVLEDTDNWCALYIDADTTIEATTGGINCLDNEGEVGTYALNVRNNATLTINGGYYHGGGTVVQAQLGKVIINAGEFSATAFEDPYGLDFVLNCKDPAYKAGTASFEVKGGSYKYFNPEDNKAEGDNTDFVADGYFAVEEDDYWTVYKYVAKIGNTYYQSLAAAVAAVPATGEETTITVVDDIVIIGNDGVTIPTTKNIVLDLNGHTVKNAVNENRASQVIKNNGILTIMDSTDTSKNGTGTGLLINAIMEGTQPGEWWSTPQYNYATNVITNCGTLTIKSGRIEQTAGDSICYAVDNQSTSYDVVLNVEGGLITGSATLVRLFCNSTVKNNELNVTGGAIATDIGYCAFWVQLPGSSATSLKRGTLNISGGTIAGATSAFYDYSFGDGWNNIEYSITGGTFIGELEVEKPGDGFITGGTFTVDPSSYVATGYEAVQSGDVWVVSEVEND